MKLAAKVQIKIFRNKSTDIVISKIMIANIDPGKTNIFLIQ